MRPRIAAARKRLILASARIKDSRERPPIKPRPPCSPFMAKPLCCNSHGPVFPVSTLMAKRIAPFRILKRSLILKRDCRFRILSCECVAITISF